MRIHHAVRARLTSGWYDEADLMAAAAAVLGRRPPVLDDLGTVIVYLPEDLSPPAADMLAALAEVAPVEVVAGMTGAADADADVVRSLTRLGLDAPSPSDRPAPDIDEIVSVSDAEEGARSAVDQALAAARDDVPLSRMAVLYPQPEPYARILHEQLTVAGITYSGAAVRPLADRLIGRWLPDLLDLDDRDFARPAVMALLTSAPVVGVDGRWLPSGTWERISREAGVVRGRAEWERRLSRYAELLEARRTPRGRGRGGRRQVRPRARAAHASSGGRRRRARAGAVTSTDTRHVERSGGVVPAHGGPLDRPSPR